MEIAPIEKLGQVVLYSGGGDNDDECDHKSLL